MIAGLAVPAVVPRDAGTVRRRVRRPANAGIQVLFCALLRQAKRPRSPAIEAVLSRGGASMRHLCLVAVATRLLLVQKGHALLPFSRPWSPVATQVTLNLVHNVLYYNEWKGSTMVVRTVR